MADEGNLTQIRDTEIPLAYRSYRSTCPIGMTEANPIPVNRAQETQCTARGLQRRLAFGGIQRIKKRESAKEKERGRHTHTHFVLARTNEMNTVAQ